MPGIVDALGGYNHTHVQVNAGRPFNVISFHAPSWGSTILIVACTSCGCDCVWFVSVVVIVVDGRRVVVNELLLSQYSEAIASPAIHICDTGIMYIKSCLPSLEDVSLTVRGSPVNT